MIKKLALLYISILSVLLVSCNEEAGFSSNPSLRLEFSCDTVSFDTLFTQVMSPTAKFIVRNRNDKSLRISSVRLEGGGASPFSVLVDGQYGTLMHDLEIRAKDSIYVLASVTVDRNNADVPLMVKDSLLFTLESGVQQSVLLLAYGRDVTFLRGENIVSDTVLEAGHYVIYDSLTVAQGAILSLQPGTTLYFHDKAFMRVEGTLIASGSLARPVVMRGDRTDNMFSYLPYDRVPGQWGGVIISSTSNGNRLSHCDIHSAKYGIRVEQGDTALQRITIESSKLYNFEGNALELNMAHATVENSLIANAQGNCVKVVGGDVSFVHCTIANFYVWKQRDVALALHNSIEGVPAPLRGALFANCVISGSREDEVMGYLTTLGDSVPDCINYRFENSLINTVPTEDSCFVNVSYDNTPYGKDHFRLIDHDNFIYDFHLGNDSTMARGCASDLYLETLPYDLDGVLRTAGAVDAGCYQFVETEEEENGNLKTEN
ncbi:MAG: hypothetical protein J6V23_07470 [Bacteroidaceae bacterium]|nr:hypothetical protein [Bacteroidaceae bacterium]